MEIKFYGANCFRISTKKTSVVIDDNLKDLQATPITKPDDIVLSTGDYSQPRSSFKLVIDQPGEYEISNISVQGIAAKPHDDRTGMTHATIYKMIVEDVRIVVLGHISPELDDKQLEALGTVDVLMLPVGGQGYTLDGENALKLIKKIEPKLIIPSHYADTSLKYPVAQDSLEGALKGLAMEPSERLPRLKLKTIEASDTARLIVLER